MTFKIATKTGIVHVDGELIKIAGHECFLHYDTVYTNIGSHYEWNVSDYKSGLLMCADLSRESVKAKAKAIIESKTSRDFIKAGQNELKRHGFIYPLNK